MKCQVCLAALSARLPGVEDVTASLHRTISDATRLLTAPVNLEVVPMEVAMQRWYDPLIHPLSM
jgi:hypothetical protein